MEIPCNEKADCDSNETCCGSVNAGNGELEVECTTTCSAINERRLCKTDEECGDAGRCETQTCRGVTISTCGGIPPQFCPN